MRTSENKKTSVYIKISVAVPAVDGPSKPGSCRLINAVAAKVYVDSLNLMQFAPSQAQRCRSDVLCSAGFEIGKYHRYCVTAVDPYDEVNRRESFALRQEKKNSSFIYCLG